MLLNEIALATSSSTVSIKKVLLHLGIDYTQVQKQLYDDRVAQVIPLYLEGRSQTYLEQTLKLTRKTIRVLLKKYDSENYRTLREQQELRHGTEINHNALNDLTPEALYWIGILYSDGHIETKHEASIELILHGDDVDHLEKCKLFFGSNRKIIKSKNSNCYRLRFNSEQIRNRLLDLGFTPNKSTTIIPHYLLKDSVDFWRGCVDGDGGVYNYGLQKGGRSNSVFLCGTLATIIDFIEFLNSNLIIQKKYPSLCKGKNLYQIQYYGKEASLVATLLYKDSTIYLERKYQKYLSITKTII
jgi:hypothetical protein